MAKKALENMAKWSDCGSRSGSFEVRLLRYSESSTGWPRSHCASFYTSLRVALGRLAHRDFLARCARLATRPQNGDERMRMRGPPRIHWDGSEMRQRSGEGTGPRERSQGKSSARKIGATTMQETGTVCLRPIRRYN